MTGISPAVAKTILCRYQADGQCVYGDSCFYSHDVGSSKYQNLCQFYLKGYCRYGNSCRFDHVKASRLSKSPPRCSSLQVASPSSYERSKSPSIMQSESKSTDGESDTGAKIEQKKKVLLDYDSQADECITDEMRELALRDTSWAEAPVFIPSGSTPAFSYSDVTRSYACDPCTVSAIGGDSEQLQQFWHPALAPGCLFPDGTQADGSNTEKSDEICPLHLTGECSFGDSCIYSHGDRCDICHLNCLHPTDKASRKTHEIECFKEHKDEIDEAFKISSSQDKVCGVCMEVVFDKPPSRRKFGILSHCNHVFCLDCLREWRCQKSFEKNVKRSCPECRVISHFVTPSPYWVDDPKEKQELIENYKKTLNKKDCKYFDKGNGVCPFGENCFYKHALPSGELAPKVPPRYQTSSSGDDRVMSAVRLFEFLLERENREHILTDLDLEDDDDFLFVLLQAFISGELSDSETDD